MHPIDKRIGELIMRLHLTRRAAEQRAYLEACDDIARREATTASEDDYANRQRNYRLAA
jgi:hypothetical protein